MPIILRTASDRFVLNAVRSRLGRSPQCELPIPGGLESVISWEHACLEHSAGVVVLIDLGSTNGTYFNGVKLEARRPVTVNAGDRFRFGLKGPEFYIESITPLPEPMPPPPPQVVVVVSPPPPPPPLSLPEDEPMPPPRREPPPRPMRSSNQPTTTQLHRAVAAIRGERRTATLIAVIGVTVCIVAVGVVLAVNFLKKKTPDVVLVPPETPPPPPTVDELRNKRRDKLMKSVVWIETEKHNKFDGKTYVGRGSGALIEVGTERYILTASHVINGADKILIAFPQRKADNKDWEVDPKQYRDNKWQIETKVVKNARNLDLALLSASTVPAECIPLKLAETSPKVPESCATLGNQSPEGEVFTAALFAFKTGEIQSIDYKRYTLSVGPVQCWMIQTSIVINQGDSGGVLVNDKDEVIGVNSNGKIEIQGGNIYNFQIEWRVIDAFVKNKSIPGPP